MKLNTFLLTGTACIAAITVSTMSAAFAQQQAPVEFGTNPDNGKRGTRMITTTPTRVEVDIANETQAYNSNNTYTGLSRDVYATTESGVTYASNGQDTVGYNQVKDLDEAETYPIREGDSYILANQADGQLQNTSAPMTAPNGAIMVAAGDTVYGLSRKYGVSPLQLIHANNLQSPFNLEVGQQLIVPGAKQEDKVKLEEMSLKPEPTTPQPLPVAQPVAPVQQPQQTASLGSVHQVAAGDTMFNISRRYNLSVNELSSANGIAAPYSIAIGQKLVIPNKQIASQTPEAKLVTTTSNKTTYKNNENIHNAVQNGEGQATIKYMKGETLGKSRFDWPLKGEVISNFGAMGNGLQNDGINIAAQLGAPIRAVEDGVVIYRGENIEPYGNLLLVSHSNGWVSAYGHADSLLVRKDERVTKGQMIGKVGATGNVSQSQLHFELRHNLTAKDPLAALEGRDPLAVKK